MTDTLEFVISYNDRPGAQFVCYPQNLKDQYRGAAGYGDTPEEAVVDFFDDMQSKNFSKCWWDRRQRRSHNDCSAFPERRERGGMKWVRD